MTTGDLCLLLDIANYQQRKALATLGTPLEVLLHEALRGYRYIYPVREWTIEFEDDDYEKIALIANRTGFTLNEITS
jgi:hypothetical protein